MTTEIVKNIALWYIIIYGMLVLIPSVILFRKLFKYLIYYVFDKVNFECKPQIEKPRTLFAGFGYLFIGLAWEIVKIDYWLCTLLAITVSLLGVFTLYFIFTKTFKNRFLRYIKEKLNLHNIEAIINTQTHYIEYIYRELNGKYFKADINEFYDMLLLNKISRTKRIEWLGTTTDLIRFLFVLFDIKSSPDEDLDHTNMRFIIEHYLQKNTESIKLTTSGSEISNVKKEVDSEKEIFSEYKNNLISIFDSNKIA